MTAPAKKHFVAVWVMMPRKRALDLYQSQLLTVQIGSDLWTPMLGKAAKLFGNVATIHDLPLRQGSVERAGCDEKFAAIGSRAFDGAIVSRASFLAFRTISVYATSEDCR
jgi:hypothetical protein